MGGIRCPARRSALLSPRRMGMRSRSNLGIIAAVQPAESHNPPSPDFTELEPAPPSVKRYQRQKLLADVASTTASLLWIAMLALLLGPAIAPWLVHVTGEQRWLEVVLMAVLVGLSLEAVTLPID